MPETLEDHIKRILDIAYAESNHPCLLPEDRFVVLFLWHVGIFLKSSNSINHYVIYDVVRRLTNRIPFRRKTNTFLSYFFSLETRGVVYASIVSFYKKFNWDFHRISIPTQSCNLTVLDFSYAQLSNRIMTSLCAAGKFFEQVEEVCWIHVRINNNFIFSSGQDLPRIFLNFLKSLSRLTVLDFSSNRLGLATKVQLDGIEEVFAKLKELILRDNAIHDGGGIENSIFSYPSCVLKKIIDYLLISDSVDLERIDFAVNFMTLRDPEMRSQLKILLDKHKKLCLDLSCNSIALIEEDPDKQAPPKSFFQGLQQVQFHSYTVESILHPNYYINEEHGVLAVAANIRDDIGHGLLLLEYMGVLGQVILKKYDLRMGDRQVPADEDDVESSSCSAKFECTTQSNGQVEKKLYNLMAFSQARHKDYGFETKCPAHVSKEKIKKLIQHQEHDFPDKKYPFSKTARKNTWNCIAYAMRHFDDTVHGHPYGTSTRKSMVAPTILFKRRLNPFDRRYYIPSDTKFSLDNMGR